MVEGYWAARADSSAAEGWARGPLYRLRRVEARVEEHEGAGSPVDGFAGGEWTGEPATRANVEAARGALRRRLSAGGFAFAETDARLLPDSSGAPFADVEMIVRRGASFKLGAPVAPETRTRPDLVRRLALWEDGENFDPDRLAKGVRRLARTGYFEAAVWTGVYRDSARNVLYPALRLPDAKVNTVGGLLGYDSDAEGGGRLTGYLDVRLYNLRGTARDGSFSFDDRDGGEREARASYTEPWVLGSPVGARWEGSFLQQDTLFWEWNQSLFVFRDLGFTGRVEAEFGAQANRETGVSGQVGTRALRSGVRVLLDDRDRVPFTRAGTRASAGVTILRRELDATAGDSAYYLSQATASWERWRPVGPRFGLRLALRGASNYPLDRTNRGELHEVGGARSLRGYREREFQTNAYLLGDLEPQLTVGRRGRLFAFVSPGLVNRLTGRYDARNVLGYGAGMEVARGDWSVAITYALNPDRSPGNGLLHAAVENRF
jgi:outer membrane protein assembly factor BamA